MKLGSAHGMPTWKDPMPRPASLPTLDWKQLFESGQDYAAWIADAESPEQAARMEAARAALTLAPEESAFLAALPHPVRVLAIAEDWCGDVIRHVPVLQKLADAAPTLDLRYTSRMAHPEIFVRFLTNGGEAIPKFVFLSKAWVECGNWGPMPQDGRRLIARGKACGDISAARKQVSALYAADPHCRIAIHELLDLLEIASCTTP